MRQDRFDPMKVEQIIKLSRNVNNTINIYLADLITYVGRIIRTIHHHLLRHVNDEI